MTALRSWRSILSSYLKDLTGSSFYLLFFSRIGVTDTFRRGGDRINVPFSPPAIQEGGCLISPFGFLEYLMTNPPFPFLGIKGWAGEKGSSRGSESCRAFFFLFTTTNSGLRLGNEGIKGGPFVRTDGQASFLLLRGERERKVVVGKKKKKGSSGCLPKCPICFMRPPLFSPF